MKVLFIGVGLVHYYNRVLNRLNALPGLEVVNLVPRSGRGHLQDGVFETRAGVEFEVVELAPCAMAKGLNSFRGLAAAIRNISPDIIVVTEHYMPGLVFNVPAWWTVKRRGIKVIMKSIPFGLDPYPVRCAAIRAIRGSFALLARIRLELNTWIFRLADAHVTYIEEAVGLYASYGVPEDRIFVTGNSPDTDHLFALDARLDAAATPPVRNPFRIIHVGRLVAWKRVDFLIEALARLRGEFPQAELLVVGDGPERQTLQAQAGECGVASAVTFTGAIHDELKLGELLRSSGVYALAGMGGLSINDAMAFGCPVVCSVCDGTEKRLVKDGVNGFYFGSTDLADLAEKLSRLLTNPELAGQMGAASREIIRNEVNIHTVLAGYQRAFAYVQGAGPC